MALVIRRKLVGIVKDEIENGRVSLKQEVRVRVASTLSGARLANPGCGCLPM